MNIIYLQPYYSTRVVNYITSNDLNGIQDDFVTLVLLDHFIDLPSFLSLNTLIFASSGIGVYYTPTRQIITFSHTIYSNDWHTFYITDTTFEANHNALIVDRDGYVIAIVLQDEDRPEDYSFRNIFIDVLIRGGSLLTRISTFKTNENFEENLLCLDLRSFTERNLQNDYLYTKYIKYEEDLNINYVRSLIEEHGKYYRKLSLNPDYLCLYFQPEQNYRVVNILQKLCKKP